MTIAAGARANDLQAAYWQARARLAIQQAERTLAAVPVPPVDPHLAYFQLAGYSVPQLRHFLHYTQLEAFACEQAGDEMAPNWRRLAGWYRMTLNYRLAAQATREAARYRRLAEGAVV